MTRAILLTSLLCGACFSGELGGPTVLPDAKVEIDATDLPPPDMGPAPGCVERGEPGIAFIHPQTNTSRAGESCAVAGCHLYGQEGNQAPGFQFAGTAYKQGTTDPDPGAIIIITPDNTAVPPIQMIVDTAGNFYSIAPLNGNAVPASAATTVCPTITKGHLSGKIATTTTPGKAGDCNTCHTPGGVQVPIYVAP